jgi:acyl-ACP thioesterase
MTDNKLTLFEKDFTVQYYETDPRGFARPVALLNYMQSTAGDHAALLGISVADLRKSGHTWVLSRVHLAMERYPRASDTVRIRTWPTLRGSIFTVRDFELLDADSELIGRATTSWAVLNLNSRRPVKLDDVLPIYPMNPLRAVDDAFSTLPLPEQPEYELSLPVLRGDLDLNRHVNNTVYAGWALETIPEQVEETCYLASIEIGFRAEALYGDTIVARVAKSGAANSYLHSITSASEGRELARLVTRWLPLEKNHH